MLFRFNTKIQELQDRKKINRLLSLAGVSENEVTYFIKEPPGKIIINQKQPNGAGVVSSRDEKETTSSFKHPAQSQPTYFSTDPNKYPRDYDSLLLQINALETQIQRRRAEAMGFGMPRAPHVVHSL